MTFDLLGIGECMVELYSTLPLSETPALERSFGGDVLNALVMASRLGASTGFISRVGKDPFGEGLHQAWQQEGIGTCMAPLVDGENGVYFISLLENGEREFTYRRAGSAASQIKPEDLDLDALKSTRALLISGITQALSDSARATTLEAAKVAHAAGAKVYYDPNHRPKLWFSRGGDQAAREAFLEVLPFVDVLLPSFPADLHILHLPNLTPFEAAERLARLGPEVALKCGEDGVFLHTSAFQGHVPAQKVPLVLDSTGAGDCWNGAFIFCHLNGKTPEEAALFANQMAARKLQHRGAIAPREAFLNPSTHIQMEAST